MSNYPGWRLHDEAATWPCTHSLFQWLHPTKGQQWQNKLVV